MREVYHPDPPGAHERCRAGRDELLAAHPCSPLPAGRRSAFTELVVVPYDPRFAFAARVDRDCREQERDRSKVWWWAPQACPPSPWA